MININSKKEVEGFDKGKILDSIRKIPDQIEQAWNEVKEKEIPKKCFMAKNVVIAGMGGSALGGRIIDSLIPERARTPIEVFTEFHIPKYVNENTLVIISSYSGNTEETISDFYDALNKKAQIYGITTGGKLKELFIQNNIPSYIFEDKENPSGQPRFGLGYSVASILALLSHCEFIFTLDEEMDVVVAEIKKFSKDLDVDVPNNTNIAKSMAEKIKGTIPILVASEHLLGSSHSFKNILNETAKSFSSLFDIPELNHHLMEGLKYPEKGRQLLKFLFIESELYNERVKKRYPITQEVLEKNDVNYFIYKARLKTKLMQAFEIMMLGSYTAFYLALLYGTDPKSIPWVDYFKERLK
jgi:glucose/mannose-6-phosphate isomerase